VGLGSERGALARTHGLFHLDLMHTGRTQADRRSCPHVWGCGDCGPVSQTGSRGPEWRVETTACWLAAGQAHSGSTQAVGWPRWRASERIEGGGYPCPVRFQRIHNPLIESEQRSGWAGRMRDDRRREFEITRLPVLGPGVLRAGAF
jgi:hypothetical protein